MRRLALTIPILATVTIVGLVVLYSRREGWQAVQVPQILKADGNRANLVLIDRPNRLIGLAATGVTWSADFSAVPGNGGWTITVAAPNHTAGLEMKGRGPALLVALAGVPSERFELSVAGFEAMVAALERAGTGDPQAPLESLSVVDVVRDSYSGPDKQRLLQLLSQYRTIIVSPTEEEALSPHPTVDEPRGD